MNATYSSVSFCVITRSIPAVAYPGLLAWQAMADPLFLRLSAEVLTKAERGDPGDEIIFTTGFPRFARNDK